jgi:hypothetical protein
LSASTILPPNTMHRHAVAPRVVHRHGGVLQADHAMADHRDRLALHLGVALPHVHGDLLVRTGENSRALVAWRRLMHGLVQAAEARGASSSPDSRSSSDLKTSTMKSPPLEAWVTDSRVGGWVSAASCRGPGAAALRLALGATACA